MSDIIEFDECDRDLNMGSNQKPTVPCQLHRTPDAESTTRQKSGSPTFKSSSELWSFVFFFLLVVVFLSLPLDSSLLESSLLLLRFFSLRDFFLLLLP